MFRRLGQAFAHDIRTVVVAVVAASVVSGPAAVAAVYVANADKVDNKHAVGSGATFKARKGKLVATNATTGRLPDNIIAKAANSARLDGYGHDKLRSVQIPVRTAVLGGNATFGGTFGVFLQSFGQNVISYYLVLPPDHRPGTPVYADMVYTLPGDPACSWYVVTTGSKHPVNGVAAQSSWLVTDTAVGSITVPAGASNTFKQTYRWADSGAPGTTVLLNIIRNGDHVTDTCGAINVVGLSFRY